VLSDFLSAFTCTDGARVSEMISDPKIISDTIKIRLAQIASERNQSLCMVWKKKRGLPRYDNATGLVAETVAYSEHAVLQPACYASSIEILSRRYCRIIVSHLIYASFAALDEQKEA